MLLIQAFLSMSPSLPIFAKAPEVGCLTMTSKPRSTLALTSLSTARALKSIKSSGGSNDAIEDLCNNFILA